MKRAAAFFLLFALGLRCEAFLRPISHLVSDVVEGRKPGKAAEFVLRHRIEIKPGQVAEVEEKMLIDRGRATLFFRVPGISSYIEVSVENRGYVFDYGKVWSRRSHLYYRTLIASSTDELLDLLLSEEFVRRDQLMQYKPSFQPTGDPNLWEIRDNYLKHDDIYMHRVGKSVTIAVAGAADSSHRRVVYFDRDHRGIRRLEWTDGQDTVAWNFEQFLKSPPFGVQPHKMTFEVNGAERVFTEVVQIRALNERQVSELRRLPHLPRGTNPPASVEELLGLLLSYR